MYVSQSETRSVYDFANKVPLRHAVRSAQSLLGAVMFH